MGKSGSQNVWESHQASPVRAQLPGIAAWGQWCNRAVVFSPTPSSHQTLWGYPELLVVEFCSWSWGVGQPGSELKVGEKDQREHPAIPLTAAKSQWSSGAPVLPVHVQLALKKQHQQKDNTQKTYVDKTYETLITNKASPSNIKNCPAF